MRRIYVRLNPTQVEALVRISEAERRHPSDQAAVMLDRVLADQAKTTPKEAVAIQ